jgi:hypothetical protein
MPRHKTTDDQALLKQHLALIEADFRDHRKWAEETLPVTTKAGNVIPYRLAPGPLKLWHAIQKQREAEQAVRVIVLKSRQVYISTEVAAYYTQEVAFNRGQRAFVVSLDTDSAENIHGYYKQFVEGYQPFRGVVKMLPHQVFARDITFEGGGYIKIETANNLQGGRSFRLNHLHLSEYAFYRDAMKMAAGLVNAVPHAPHTSIIKESTANGVENEFHEDWLEASDPTSGSAYLAVFLGYWEHPENRLPVADPARFQDSLTRDELEEQKRYQLTLHQLMWRRVMIQDVCRGSVELFRQEHPGNPEEAFLQSGRPRFSREHMARMPVIDPPLVGELEAFQNSPVSRVISILPNNPGSVVIYQKPAKGRSYVIGVDVAEGIDVSEKDSAKKDPDYTVACVLDRDTGEQVAKLRGRIWPSEAGPQVATLAEWYNWAFVVPERNSVGVALIDALKLAGYPLYLIFSGQPTADDMDPGKMEFMRLGWSTSPVSRVQLISALDESIRTLSVLVRDRHTLSELRTFVIWPNGAAKAQRRKHDDEVIALALANIGIRFAPSDTRLSQLRALQPASMRLNPTVQQYGKSRSGGRDIRSTFDPDARGPLVRF